MQTLNFMHLDSIPNRTTPKTKTKKTQNVKTVSPLSKNHIISHSFFPGSYPATPTFSTSTSNNRPNFGNSLISPDIPFIVLSANPEHVLQTQNKKWQVDINNSTIYQSIQNKNLFWVSKKSYKIFNSVWIFIFQMTQDNGVERGWKLTYFSNRFCILTVVVDRKCC